MPVNAPMRPVSVFAEPDYCFGAGPLTLRVDGIDWAGPIWYEGERWYYVDGIEADLYGAERRRRVLVRGRRLPAPPHREPGTHPPRRSPRDAT